MVVVAVHYILQNKNTNISITNNDAVLITPRFIIMLFRQMCYTNYGRRPAELRYQSILHFSIYFK